MDENIKAVQEHLHQANSLLNDAIYEYVEAYKVLAGMPFCTLQGDLSPLNVCNIATQMSQAGYLMYWMNKRVDELVKMSETQTNQFEK